MKYKNLILSFVLFIIVILLILKIYVKVKHQFWSIQPVFHIYNLKNWVFPEGIIEKSLPTPNKFCDFLSTYTVTMEQQDNEKENNEKESNEKESNEKESKYVRKNKEIIFSPELEKNFVQLIKKHYLQTKNVSYSPESENIIPYFKYHCSGNLCFLT